MRFALILMHRASIRTGSLLSQAMSEDEKVFSCQLHDQDVKVFCEDAMRMAQLGREVTRNYGMSPFSTCRSRVIIVF